MAVARPRELEIPSRLWPEEQRADWRMTHMVNKVSVDPAGSNYTYGETTINWGFNLDKGIYRKYKNHDLKLIFLVRNQNENTLYYVVYYLSWKYESVDKKAWHQAGCLGSVPMTHMVEAKNCLLQAGIWCSHVPQGPSTSPKNKL